MKTVEFTVTLTEWDQDENVERERDMDVTLPMGCLSEADFAAIADEAMSLAIDHLARGVRRGHVEPKPDGSKVPPNEALRAVIDDDVFRPAFFLLGLVTQLPADKKREMYLVVLEKMMEVAQALTLALGNEPSESVH